MLPDIPSYLVYALRYILRMGPLTEEPLIKPLGEVPAKGNIVSVTPWRDHAVRAYLQSDISRQCEVVEIRRYKKNKPPQHEYLVAGLQCQDGEKRYVSIERSSQNVDADTGEPILSKKQMSFVGNCSNSASHTSGGDIFPDDISSGFWTSWTTSVDEMLEDPQRQPPPRSDRNISSTSSASISKTSQARYIVDGCELPHPNSRHEKEIENFKLNHPIPLAYLAILADVVHQQEALYNLFKYQCYWYADMIAAVIYKQDRGNAAKSYSTASPLCEPQQRCFDRASGKYKMISVLKIRPLVVEEIERTYLAECGRLSAEMVIACFRDF